MIHLGREHQGDLELDADVVVVGSGAGGAVAACELAEAGRSVIVLEEGDHTPPERYREMRPSESLRRLFREGGTTMALGVGDSPMINVTMGKGVGGSSVITGGVCFRIPGHVLHDWREIHRLEDLTEGAMDAYLDEVERSIHVETVPVDMRSKSTALFGEGCQKLGMTMKPMRRNTQGCCGCGRCNFGCPHGAKLSVDVTYLPRAFAAGAQLFTHCLVDRVVTKSGRATGVIGRVLNGNGGRLTVHAKDVVIAAGSYHTPLILKRSGIGKRSGQVGRNMTLHPAFRMMAAFDAPVYGWRGALQSAFVDALEDERITMMSVFVPPGVVAATMPGIGAEHVRRARELPHVAMFGGLIHDEGGGTVRRGFGREPFVTYRMSEADRAVVPRILRVMGEIFLAAGARELFLPILGLAPVDADAFAALDLGRVPLRRMECSSQHPLGTCRMGAAPESSVVDPRGRAWELDNLHLADGSVVPTSLGVNPQLTIMSMALRIARGIHEDAGRVSVPRPSPAPAA